MAVKPIPEGYNTVIPHLSLRDCTKAVEFYKKVFGAEERNRAPGPGGGHPPMNVLQPQLAGRPESHDPGWRRPVVDRTQTSLVKP
jgi:hypothetical protein